MATSKRSNEQTMGEALSQWLDRYRLRQGTENSRVLQAWDEVMGPSVARQTSRKKVENGVLIIQLDSSVVRKELLMVRGKIVHAINEHVGRTAIKDLQIF